MKNKIISLSILIAMMLTGCEDAIPGDDYGVYIGAEYSELPENASFDVIVIDAQYYTADEIASLKETNGEIYSYLNVGSVESFRDYYEDYEDITTGSYENWEDERWVDVSNPKWQDFVVGELAPQLIEKDIDGFFIDNCDVYYIDPRDEIYDGLTTILSELKATGKSVIVNGGDAYVSRYLDENNTLDKVIDGVNQESVYTSINWDDGTFGEATDDDREYFLDYLERVSDAGGEVYLLEYTNDEKLACYIEDECEAKEYHVYISSTLELNGDKDKENEADEVNIAEEKTAIVEEQLDEEASKESTDEKVTTAEVRMTTTNVKDTENFYGIEFTEDSDIFTRIKGKSYKDDCTVPLSDLRYLHVLHLGFDGQTHEGEIICNKAIAEDLLEIFEQLYEAGYQIEKIKLVDEYNAEDEASMADNNSSCFNFRFISHTTKISNHGKGMAIDINPLYNPYIKTVNGNLNIEPANSTPYVDRTADFPHKIDETDLAYQLFTAHGFSWGGAWTSSKDYQHFEK